MHLVVTVLRNWWLCSLAQEFGKDLKSGHPKCAAGHAKINNKEEEDNMKNKSIFVNKWLSTVCLDTHLAKSLPLHFQRSLCLSNMRFNL